MEAIIIAVVAAVPATIASVASWRHAKSANQQTNGVLKEPLSRIESKIDDLTVWQDHHIGRWHQN